MSFFKKFSKEIDQFKDKFLGDDDKKEGGSEDHTRGYESQPQYGAPPPLPPGWIAQWDQNGQRWFYLEQATGRTQWEFPANYPPQPPAGYGAPYGGHPAPAPEAPYGGAYYGGHVTEDKKNKGHMGILAGAVGGLAVGGLIGHAMGDESSDEEHHVAPPIGAPQPDTGYYDQSGPPPPAAPLPDVTADGDSVSSSDEEDVEKARDEYEEAIADGDSRSDIEEAREEYEEEYEETYE